MIGGDYLSLTKRRLNSHVLCTKKTFGNVSSLLIDFIGISHCMEKQASGHYLLSSQVMLMKFFGLNSCHAHYLLIPRTSCGKIIMKVVLQCKNCGCTFSNTGRMIQECPCQTYLRILGQLGT